MFAVLVQYMYSVLFTPADPARHMFAVLVQYMYSLCSSLLLTLPGNVPHVQCLLC